MRCGTRATPTHPPVDDRLYINKPRPFPQYPSITYADNGAKHDYHGVTFEAERRFSKRLCSSRPPTRWRATKATRSNWFTAPIEDPFDLERENAATIPPRRGIA